MKTGKTVGTEKSRTERSASRPLAEPTASDSAEQAQRPSPAMKTALEREHEHTRGRAWDSEDGATDDTDTDVLPRDRDLVDETEDRE